MSYNTIYLTNTDQIAYPLIDNMGKKNSISIRSCVRLHKDTGAIVMQDYEVILNYMGSKPELLMTCQTYTEAYDFIPAHIARHYPNETLRYDYLVYNREDLVLHSGWHEEFAGYPNLGRALNAGQNSAQDNRIKDAVVCVKYTLVKVKEIASNNH